MKQPTLGTVRGGDMRTHLTPLKQYLDHVAISSYLGFDTLTRKPSLILTGAICNMPLDPHSVLSVAAPVIQLLSFSSKIVLKGVQAYKSSD
jgi:hypothetical protein